jgi:hypothetical protein
MVSYIRYIPRGYIDSEAALLRIAKTRHPDRWRSELMHEKETEIYSGLGTRYNAEVLGGLLREQIPRADREANKAIAERLFDFEDAAYDLRIALHAGDLIAEFVDERGEFGWVKSEGWGGDEGLWILLRGVVWLDDSFCRLTLFKIDSVDKFASELHVSSTTKRHRASEVAMERGFKEWREDRKDDIPSEREDFHYMKRKFGASRDDVRELRRTAPKLLRGRPPAKKRTDKSRT